MADQFPTHRVFQILLPQGFNLTFCTTVPGKLVIRPAHKKYDATVVQILTSEDRAKKVSRNQNMRRAMFIPLSSSKHYAQAKRTTGTVRQIP